MNHATYDRLADWLEARKWTEMAAIYVGVLGGLYGLTFGIVVSPWFLFLLVLAALGALLVHVRMHGFERALDRKYPTVADLDCSFDADVWISALEGLER